ncbi:MAG: hypothetical protein F6K41_29980 [Symploca sp. SIO3E6]|nr:hypothetical protein [Caldora sp. SIO3E6]
MGSWGNWGRRGDAGTRGRGDEEEEPQFFDSLVVSIYGVLLVPKRYIYSSTRWYRYSFNE